MSGQNLAITFACITILSGCSNIGDSISSYIRDLPDDAPKGLALYLDAQDWLAKKDYKMAAFCYCDVRRHLKIVQIRRQLLVLEAF